MEPEEKIITLELTAEEAVALQILTGACYDRGLGKYTKEVHKVLSDLGIDPEDYYNYFSTSYGVGFKENCESFESFKKSVRILKSL